MKNGRTKRKYLSVEALASFLAGSDPNGKWTYHKCWRLIHEGRIKQIAQPDNTKFRNKHRRVTVAEAQRVLKVSLEGGSL